MRTDILGLALSLVILPPGIAVPCFYLGLGSLTATAAEEFDPRTDALRFFEAAAIGRSDGREILSSLRPSPVSETDRVRALASVPPESVLLPDAKERKKLEALQAVLILHERQQTVGIQVIDVQAAGVWLNQRAVVLISRPALGLLTDAELEATLAHEIGHDYFWREDADVRARHDTRLLQVLELKCDGIAVLTLVALGLNPAHLPRALEKLALFNGVPNERWGSNGYPPPRDRQIFINALLAIIVGKGKSHDWTAPGELLKTDSRAFKEWIDRARPASLPKQDRARVLSGLPTEGEITRLDHRGQRKLDAVRAVLEAMDRASAYEIKVVDVPVLRIGVYERTVILISGPALSVLGSEELQAVAAHEIGHEYFTDDYERAFALKNTERLKKLELMCDAIAIVTLERLHLKPSRLMSAVVKSTSYNRLHFGDSMDQSAYPTLSERQTFASEVIAWLRQGR